jgi:beta-lactam-binding protein with PASTA domain
MELGIMPDLTEFTAEEAIAFVVSHGFGAWAREAYTDRVDPGFVVATDPRAGTAANITPIIIWYAVPVPLVVDRSGDPLTDQTPVIPEGTPTPLKG